MVELLWVVDDEGGKGSVVRDSLVTYVIELTYY
jgi:hypothetical protein